MPDTISEDKVILTAVIDEHTEAGLPVIKVNSIYYTNGTGKEKKIVAVLKDSAEDFINNFFKMFKQEG